MFKNELLFISKQFMEKKKIIKISVYITYYIVVIRFIKNSLTTKQSLCKHKIFLKPYFIIASKPASKYLIKSIVSSESYNHRKKINPFRYLLFIFEKKNMKYNYDYFELHTVQNNMENFKVYHLVIRFMHIHNNI